MLPLSEAVVLLMLVVGCVITERTTWEGAVIGVDADVGVGVDMSVDIGVGVGVGTGVCAGVGLHPPKGKAKTKRRETKKIKELHFLVADLFMPVILQPSYHLHILT